MCHIQIALLDASQSEALLLLLLLLVMCLLVMCLRVMCLLLLLWYRLLLAA
jgi:hypothetical protein